MPRCFHLQVRDEIGTDTPGDSEFGLGSGISLNGQIYEMKNSTADSLDFSEESSIGGFTGFCSVVSDIKGELLCTYEIFLDTPFGQVGVGIFVVTGPVAGLETGVEFESVVTGAEFDFIDFSKGVMTTIQDAEKPVLYASLSLSA